MKKRFLTKNLYKDYLYKKGKSGFYLMIYEGINKKGK